jgi:hypothetical protein
VALCPSIQGVARYAAAPIRVALSCEAYSRADCEHEAIVVGSGTRSGLFGSEPLYPLFSGNRRGHSGQLQMGDAMMDAPATRQLARSIGRTRPNMAKSSPSTSNGPAGHTTCWPTRGGNSFLGSRATSAQSLFSVLKLVVTAISLAGATQYGSPGPRKQGCSPCEIQMLNVVARWRRRGLRMLSGRSQVRRQVPRSITTPLDANDTTRHGVSSTKS